MWREKTKLKNNNETSKAYNLLTEEQATAWRKCNSKTEKFILQGFISLPFKAKVKPELPKKWTVSIQS